MSFVYAAALFGFMIFIHELGHFLAAKMFQVRVLKFSLGFGPKVLSKKIGETEYLLSALPLGGYVKMHGEGKEDPSDPDSLIDDPEHSYKNKPVYQRAIIVFAGPLFNLLSAVVIFWGIYIVGVPALTAEIGEVMPNTPAQAVGLQKGDTIVAINGSEIKHWLQMTEIVQKHPNQVINLKVLRDNQTLSIPITPETKTSKNIFGEPQTVGMIGVKPSGKTFTTKYSVVEALDQAITKTIDICHLTIVGIIKLIQQVIPADNIGGPVMIFQLAEKQASVGAISFFAFAAVISINLGLLNLLPIPVLDGGHLVFLAIEAIRGKPLNEKVVEVAHRVGMALLILLMAFAMYNDIFRIFTGKPIP